MLGRPSAPGCTFKWQKWITRTKLMMKDFELFEILQKFAEILRFEYGNLSENPKSSDFVDFLLHSLYKRRRIKREIKQID